MRPCKQGIASASFTFIKIAFQSYIAIRILKGILWIYFIYNLWWINYFYISLDNQKKKKFKNRSLEYFISRFQKPESFCKFSPLSNFLVLYKSSRDIWTVSKGMLPSFSPRGRSVQNFQFFFAYLFLLGKKKKENSNMINILSVNSSLESFLKFSYSIHTHTLSNFKPRAKLT